MKKRIMSSPIISLDMTTSLLDYFVSAGGIIIQIERNIIKTVHKNQYEGVLIKKIEGIFFSVEKFSEEW